MLLAEYDACHIFTSFERLGHGALVNDAYRVYGTPLSAIHWDCEKSPDSRLLRPPDFVSYKYHMVTQPQQSASSSPCSGSLLISTTRNSESAHMSSPHASYARQTTSLPGYSLLSCAKPSWWPELVTAFVADTADSRPT